MKVSERDISSAKDRLLSVIEARVELTKVGSEYEAPCPFHSEKTPSFRVSQEKGFYHCFGCGAHGDAVDFVREYDGLTFHEAVKAINGGSLNGTPQSSAGKREAVKVAPDEWQQICPVPDGAPAPSDKFWAKRGGEWVELVASRRWAYRDAQSMLIGYVARFELPNGGKDVIPQIYCQSTVTGEIMWRWKSFPKPRPIYGLDDLIARPGAQVIIVEGEKACDAARARPEFSNFVVISWPGGSKAIKYVDWSPLEGRRIGLWPDADKKVYVEGHPKAGEVIPFPEQIGTLAMLDIYQRIKGTAKSCKLIVPPAGMPDGWDLADDPPAPDWNAKDHIIKSMVDPEVLLKKDEPAPTPPPVIGEPEPAPAAAAPAVQAPEPAVKAAASTPAAEKKRKAPPADPPVERGPVATEPFPDNPYFGVLGHDHDQYYFYQKEQRQVRVMTRGDFSDNGLLSLARMEFWDEFSMAKEGKYDRKAIVNALMMTAYKRGIYDPTRVRGRGAWMDAGRFVFHFGSHLMVDGVKTDFNKFSSRFVYELAKSLEPIYDIPLSNEDGRKLLDIAKMFRWSMPASAPLLLGWVALAPVCGALPWRPHAWITGENGSGKSTISEKFVNRLLNKMHAYFLGNSTEAGIRQLLGTDSLPVLIEEAEGNDDNNKNNANKQRIQQIVILIRNASSESGAQTVKGSANGHDPAVYHTRSMFCLVSIDPQLQKKADYDRMTLLAVKSKNDPSYNDKDWKVLEAALDSLDHDETIGARLVNRAIRLLPITRKNIKVFVEAAAAKLGTQRAGDQFGTLMAGCWSMLSEEEVTPEHARKLLDQYQWDEYRENSEVDEATTALTHLTGARVRLQGGGELTVSELIAMSYGIPMDGAPEMTPIAADAILQRFGMKVKGEYLLVSNQSPEPRKLVETSSSQFSLSLKVQLLRLKGATRYENRPERFRGIQSKCVAVPLELVLDKSLKQRTEQF